MVPAELAHFFVADLDLPELSPGDLAHLLGPLRAEDGAIVTCGDGRGSWRLAMVRRRGRREAELEPAGPVEREAMPGPALGVAFALTAATRPERVARRLTEVGVDRLVVLVAKRSPPLRSQEAMLGRIERVVREAASQSRRAWIPTLAVADGLEAAGELLGGRPALADRGGGPWPAGISAAMSGPEGGWAPEERAWVAEAGWPLVGLGPTQLRAETAAVACGVILSACRAGAVRPAQAEP